MLSTLVIPLDPDLSVGLTITGNLKLLLSIPEDFEYKPRKYSAVFFPSAGSEYIHGITTVTSGIRHTALYMHTSLPEHADPDFVGGQTLTSGDWAAAQDYRKDL